MRVEGTSRAHRILVVDDNPQVADSFQVMLETMGHQVRARYSGEAALATISDFRPDVAFLDIGMPGMDGYQLAAAIRAAGLEPGPLLVAVTGYGLDSDRKAAMNAGFDRYLLKPPSPEQLEALLQELG
jgi:CheY-like chemotaxis protein